jgi:hypothetical protein
MNALLDGHDGKIEAARGDMHAPAAGDNGLMQCVLVPVLMFII